MENKDKLGNDSSREWSPEAIAPRSVSDQFLIKSFNLEFPKFGMQTAIHFDNSLMVEKWWGRPKSAFHLSDKVDAAHQIVSTY